MLSVTAENIDCFDSGLICRKSLLINIGRSFVAFDDDTGKPVRLSFNIFLYLLNNDACSRVWIPQYRIYLQVDDVKVLLLHLEVDYLALAEITVTSFLLADHFQVKNNIWEYFSQIKLLCPLQNPSSVIDRKQQMFIWPAGYFTVVHFPEEDVTILWDRKTTIHIQVGPRWQVGCWHLYELVVKGCDFRMHVADAQKSRI